MSSASAYSLEVPAVRQWKAKISFPYADPPGFGQGACAFLTKCLGFFLCFLALISEVRLK
ncbi:hypothetical protein [Alteribacillus sp. YIM 98480]|uniref:hypothetical protein n=1 Tax=Alteribacillus sp. YIM 98480 TaxID=2606599 RepID=UPI00131C2939|nr:hypothetical protein [Alteribacillus sp. YIM 98480]